VLSTIRPVERGVLVIGGRQCGGVLFSGLEALGGRRTLLGGGSVAVEGMVVVVVVHRRGHRYGEWDR
jgi:hypothetical protein